MNREDRKMAINLLARFQDDPSIVPDRSLHDSELLLEGGLMALDKNMFTTADQMLRRSKQLAEEAFAAFLRTDIALATHVNDILGRIEEGLRDLEGMLQSRR